MHRSLNFVQGFRIGDKVTADKASPCTARILQRMAYIVSILVVYRNVVTPSVRQSFTDPSLEMRAGRVYLTALLNHEHSNSSPLHQGSTRIATSPTQARDTACVCVVSHRADSRTISSPDRHRSRPMQLTLSQHGRLPVLKGTSLRRHNGHHLDK